MFHFQMTLSPNVFCTLLSSGFSIYSVREPGSSTGPQMQSVSISSTDLSVWTWKTWSKRSKSLGAKPSETQRNEFILKVF